MVFSFNDLQAVRTPRARTLLRVASSAESKGILRADAILLALEKNRVGEIGAHHLLALCCEPFPTLLKARGEPETVPRAANPVARGPP